MKHIKLASTMALIIGVGLAGSASATNQGTMNFKGEVGDTTCIITGGVGAVGNENFTVTLPGVDDPAALETTGVLVNTKNFEVNIGANGASTTCRPGKVASLTFDTNSNQIDRNTGALKNTLQEGPQNVQIVLSDEKGQRINLADPSYHQEQTLVNNPSQPLARLKFSASYMAVGDVTPGEIETNIAYLINYN